MHRFPPGNEFLCKEALWEMNSCIRIPCAGSISPRESFLGTIKTWVYVSPGIVEKIKTVLGLESGPGGGGDFIPLKPQTKNSHATVHLSLML